MPTKEARASTRVDAVRRFSRFYTRWIGLLGEGVLHSSFSLTEARVLYELAHRKNTTATQLAEVLGLDRGYLSRLIRRLQKLRLLVKERAPADGRVRVLSLTKKGRKTFEALNEASDAQVRSFLEGLADQDQHRLVKAMRSIERTLGGEAGTFPATYILRPPEPGDLGWVVQRHGALYAAEHGWSQEFEGLAAEILGRYVKNHDAKRERCWIAERHDEKVGSIFLMKKSEQVAQLRMLFVDPRARGLGIGVRLVQECTRFARRTHYKKIMLWTDNHLHTARRIYEAEGYELVKEEPHHSFGYDLVGQTWELAL